MKIEVDQYERIRYLYAVQGFSKREIARQLNISRNTVTKYCNGNTVPWERQPNLRKSTVMTPEVKDFIERCLQEDQDAPRKQHHTAKRIYDRLIEDLCFQGSESTIRLAVREIKADIPQVFIPLSFEPGEAAQVDWGEATIYLNGVRTKVMLFCMRLCHSCAYFVMAFPSQNEESFLEGHIQAFQYFGGVPKRLIYDNLKTAVKEGWGRHVTAIQDRFRALKAHYVFKADFCNPGEGHEKGLVENLVGFVRRNALVPIPRIQSWNELNHSLLANCQKYLGHQIKGRSQTVGKDFDTEKAALLQLPGYCFDSAKQVLATVDYYSTVKFGRNRYSAPIELAGKQVTVKGYGFTVQINFKNQTVATHERCYGKDETRFQLSHYIRLLEQRPRALFNAKPVKQANLPQELWEWASQLPGGNADLVKVLRLIVDYGTVAVVNAIHQAKTAHLSTYESILFYLNLRQSEPYRNEKDLPVKTVDLSVYDNLLMEVN
jgi:transposase